MFGSSHIVIGMGGGAALSLKLPRDTLKTVLRFTEGFLDFNFAVRCDVFAKEDHGRLKECKMLKDYCV